jgi:hypothetical protein
MRSHSRATILSTFILSLLTIALYAQWEQGIVLEGMICTMNEQGEIIPEGRLLITKEGTISLLNADDPIPAAYEDAVMIDTKGVIYPGLIDMHNHPAYNILPIWPVPKQYETRYQWPSHSSYKDMIRDRYNYMWKEKSYKTYMGIYAEVKSMAGGTTSLQGLPANKIYGKYMVRNLEMKNFGIDRIGANVMKMSRSSQNFESTKANLENKLDGWFYHLAEGTSPRLKEELYDLQDFGFNLEPVIGIHCTALDSADFAIMDSANMKAIWSPLSNLLLYGATAKMDKAKQAGVMIGLGSDWSPSGSKNILWELKVAALWNRSHFNDVFSPEELVRMVTSNAAKILKWDDKVGSIQDGMMADIIVTNQKHEDPYINLLLCTEEDINLVIISGDPYYGDKDLIKKLKRIGRKHDFHVIDRKFPGKKAIDVTWEGLMDEDFEIIYETLEDEMKSDSFPVSPLFPDPMYTSEDADFFRLIWSVPHNPLEVMKLASFVHPIGKAIKETAIRESPRSKIIVKMPIGSNVIIVKEASGRRRNWHEILWKNDTGEVFHGLARKRDIELVTTPEEFGNEFFNRY